MIGLKSACAGELLGVLLELAERLKLPGQVVHPDRAAAGGGVARAGTKAEEREVVVVGGVRRLEEDGAVAHRGRDPEAEDVAVERRAACDVADVQDRVVEAGDGHQGLLGRRGRVIVGQVY